LRVAILFSFISFCSAQLLGVEASASDERDQKDNKVDTSTKESSELKPKQDSAEKFFMPVQTWLEEKAQKSSVLNPSQKNNRAKPNTKSSLRDAIKKAQSMFPGTVLSAKRMDSRDAVFFKIKILSMDGIIKEIEVASSDLDKDHTP
jgi:uncharacterized membrane protein YkoI